MIQKEQIKERRKEIAEIRHADSVYRDIIARENERDDYEKRWFWELLQNAKDSVNEDNNESVKVKIEISETQISFSHTGNPFELDDILSLIIQGSSKNNKKGKTGRFGTGFMTTYLLSKKVYIYGKLTNNQGCFGFLLNREAKSNEDFYERQQESNEEFDNSIKEYSYLDDSEFQTKFVYELNNIGRATAEVGLKCLDELIPITQLFNNQIESVIVIESGRTKTYTKSHVAKHENFINEWEINTIIDRVKEKSFKAYILNDKEYDACIITYKKEGIETVFPLTENYPRLYFTFPLIGTEEIGIPLVINSTHFDPKVERDGIYLKKISENANESVNKEIISNSILKSIESFAGCFLKKNIRGIHELFNFKVSKDLKWIDHDWFTKVKNKVIAQLSLKSVIQYDENKYCSLNEIKIPYSIDEKNTKHLWSLLSYIKSNKIKVPLCEELIDWVSIAKNISELAIKKTYELSYVWRFKDLIKFVEEKENLELLRNDLDLNVEKWLNHFYLGLTNVFDVFPLDKKIVLNQEDDFRKAEGISWDKCRDDILIQISSLINLSFAKKLVSRKIDKFHIVGVDEFTLEKSINELKNGINNLKEGDFSKLDYLVCNAKFLKWLISKKLKEVIKDLKVLTGGNVENWSYSVFPKAEHLLLSPITFFGKKFPLFAKIVREKDCLNEIYGLHLIDEDYKYLEVNGFIHYHPLVVKEGGATLKILESLVINQNDLNLLRDSEGKLKFKFKIKYTDFAYLTTTEGHIYARNSTQKSSLDRFKFLLTEAVELDEKFETDKQELKIEGLDKIILLRECYWVYRAKNLNWINVRTESENSEVKFVSETPSSKNLSELLKGEDLLIKEIRGTKQQLLLNKLGVGVSDLIRNTLSNDELRISWDRAITNMIVSDVDPELVQEIFNDPHVKKEYEKRLNQRKLISRNQKIGKLIEDLFKEYIQKLQIEKKYTVKIERKPFGSDYLLTDESSDLVNGNNEREGFKINDWLVELKATGKKHASMTPLQAETATGRKDNYALIVVPLDGTEPDIEYIRSKAKVITNIGYQVDGVVTDFKNVELKKASLNVGKDGISVTIMDENVRFQVSASIWEREQTTLESFIKEKFIKKKI